MSQHTPGPWLTPHTEGTMSERHKHEWEPDGSGLYICAGCSKTKPMSPEDAKVMWEDDLRSQEEAKS